MRLSVLIPEAPAGTAKMLERELSGIDAELITGSWGRSLKKISGDFVCFLEEDSAVRPGSIASTFKVFTDNPSYRKLAMVAMPVDYPDEASIVYGYTEGAQRRFDSSSDSIHAIRAGSLPGAVLRVSALKKFEGMKLDASLDSTMNLCFNLWEAGQRILLNPEALYYAPDIEVQAKSSIFSRAVRSDVLSAWEREMVH